MALAWFAECVHCVRGSYGTRKWFTPQAARRVQVAMVPPLLVPVLV